MILAALLLLLQSDDELSATIESEKASTQGGDTFLSFKFKLQGGVLMAVNFSESEIRSMGDDVGTELGTHKAGMSSSKSSACVFSSTGKSESGASVTLLAHKACIGRSVSAEGYLDFWQAARIVEGEDRILLEKGSTFRIGPYDLTVESIERGQRLALGVKLVSEKPFPSEWAKEIRFFEGAKKVAVSSENGQTTEEKTDKGKRWVYAKTWYLERDVSELAVKYKVYIDPLRKKVPFRVTAELQQKK